MSEKICCECIRKTECYTPGEVEKLKPGETYADKTGYDCGVAFTNYEELREFLYMVGDAIQMQGTRTQNKILHYLACKTGLPMYNVMMEVFRS